MSPATLTQILAATTSGILAGFMISYCLVFGAYASHVLATGTPEAFQASYTAFRARTRVERWYMLWVAAQYITALAALLCHLDQFPNGAHLFAVLAPPLIGVLHRATGFAPVEEKYMSGKHLTDSEKALYLRLNLPLHWLYAAVFTASALWLLADLAIAPATQSAPA